MLSTNCLVIQNDAISDLALGVTQAVPARSDEAQSIMGDQSAPLALARALSDFFQIAGALEGGAASLEHEERNEFCA